MIVKIADGTRREEVPHELVFKGTKKLKCSSGLLMPGDFPQFYAFYSMMVTEIEICTTVPVGICVFVGTPNEINLATTMFAKEGRKEKLASPFEIPSKTQFRLEPTFDQVERLVVVSLKGMLRKPITGEML